MKWYISNQLFFVLAFTLLWNTAHAQEDIFFAGFAYLGDSGSISKNYPYTSAINSVKNEKGQPLIDAALVARLNEVTTDKYNLLVSELGNIRMGQTLALAMTLDRETVSYEKICGENKVVIDIAIQAMVVDFETMAVIGSFPITIQYIDLLDSEPTDDIYKDIVSKMYFGGVEVNIIDEFISLLNSIEIKRKYKNRIQVSNVTLEEKALPVLPKKYKNDQAAFKTFVAQSFSKALSDTHKVSVLPYTKGSAIGGKMSTRFSNGEVFNFKIPEADYEIDLTIRGFKKVEHDVTATATSMIYGSYMKLKIYEPLSGKSYIDHKFKRGATKVIPKCQLEADDWPAYQESMLGLFGEISNQISLQEKSWAKTHADDKAVAKEFKNVEKVIEKCK